ncbi:MAG: hypothetical protein OXE58_01050 [Acidobacteria bacterium]|nr:hypothetical protein [Acidobacteriota bacterium]
MNQRSNPGPWRVAALASSLLVAACGGDSGSPSVLPVPAPPPDSEPAPELLLPDDPSAVILEVWVHGGLLPPHLEPRPPADLLADRWGNAQFRGDDIGDLAGSVVSVTP